MNWWIFFLVALIPPAVGAVYYNPRVVGGAWMRITGLDEERLKRGNTFVIFGLAYLFSLIVAAMLSVIVVHQTGLSGIFGMMPEFSDPASALRADLAGLEAKYGLYTNHRTFGHGVLHGAMFGLTMAAAIIAINAIFERRRWNYVLIHVGYWTVTLALMGGVLAQYLVLDYAV